MSPPRTIRQPRIEGLLQTTAKNIYAQGEKLGIGVRNAVDEVQKKAQEIRVSQTPSPPPWRQSSVGRVRELETRNKQLSELLASAVDELWEYQRSVAEAKDHAHDRNNVEKLSAAIAQVQYIQVYLEQPSLQLAEQPLQVNKRRGDANNVPGTTMAQHDVSSYAGEASGVNDERDGKGELRDHPTHEPEPPTLRVRATHDLSSSQSSDTTGVKTHRLRPSLEQSSFSFMLGQGGSKASPPPSRPHSSLFGAQDNTSGRPGSKAGSNDVLSDSEFDIGSLKRAKGDRR